MNDRQQDVSRRRVVAGVGTVGALAAVATVLPTRRPIVAGAAEVLPAVDAFNGGGYRETAHVLRYYQTTRV